MGAPTLQIEWHGGGFQCTIPGMSVSEIKRLPLREKLQIMEALWDDLHERFDSSEVSPEVRSLLDDRRARVQRGDARLLEWDSVKGTIGRA